MSKIILSEEQSFTINVPYKLIETGGEGQKPLIVYLHGYKQNLALFKKKVADLLQLQAWHLFLQGPYAIYDEKHRRNVENWGRAWYLYDGRQDQFLESLEKSSIFIQQILERVKAEINPERLALVGYSMGGYQAGYFALSRPELIDDLAVIGGRIKTECFKGKSYPNLNVLALHGRFDKSVDENPEKESCMQLKEMGASVEFISLDKSHKLNNAYIQMLKKWLKDSGYVPVAP